MDIRFNRRRLFAAFLLGASALIIGGCGYLLIDKHRAQRLSQHAQAAQNPKQADAIGFVDSLSEESRNRTRVSGWALARAGVARVEVVLNGQDRIPLKIAMPRPDVLRAHPGYPDSDKAGFDGIVDTVKLTPRWHTMEVVVTDKKGESAVISRRTQPAGQDMKTWTDLLDVRGVKREDIFYFPMATSNVAAGGAKEIDTIFRPYESKTVKVGIRVPILYLRTTKGKAGNYAFDPDFPLDRKCGQRAIADDNLHGVIRYAVMHKMPVLFTLNGGIWADAACNVPEWDINDVLEEDAANCQWNQDNAVMPDDSLKKLSGSMESPELGRSLSFNIYAEKNRFYKKRNLQQAAAVIHAFAVRHPDLFIGVTLDPDTYLNPFFDGKQWYDFNPGSLRQFREWLQGIGPYALQPTPGQLDLSRYRRPKPLTLAEVNTLSGQHFSRWDEVDPPRTVPSISRFFPDSAWAAEWEQFRRHLVGLHYDELSRWIEEAGIGKAYIYSAQGFMAPAPSLQPFAVRISSPLKNYDTGGMSVEGAKPSHGHLGAILYGPSAVNQIRMEEERSLFSVFREIDPDWAVVEHNTADLRNPTRLPDFAEAYRSLRDIHNYGARFVSSMAWNGSRGSFSGQPGFVSYTTLRDSPLEDAIKNFMISHANLPRKSRLWTFGSGLHADGDAWVPAAGTAGRIGPGMFMLTAAADGQGSLESPEDLGFKPANYSAIIVKAGTPEVLRSIEVQGQRPDGRWAVLIPATDASKLKQVNAGWLLPVAGTYADTEFKRIRLNWKAMENKPLALERIAFYAR